MCWKPTLSPRKDLLKSKSPSMARLILYLLLHSTNICTPPSPPPNNKNLQHSCTSFPSCLVVNWENTLIKMSILTYDQTINQCTSNYMLWHHSHQPILHKELQNLCDFNALVKAGTSAWVAPILKRMVQPDGLLTSGTSIE